MAFYSTVSCGEVSHSDSMSNTGQWTPSAVLSVPYAERYNLINDILGNHRIFPHAEGLNHAPRAVTAEIENIGELPATAASPQLRNYDKSHVTIGYAPLQLASDPDSPFTAFTEVITPSIDFIRLDHKRFIWSSGRSLKKDETNALPLARLKFTRTYFNFTGSVPSAFLTAQATCNQGAITSQLLGLTFGSQTLAFAPEQVTHSISSDGSTTKSVSVSFHYRQEGWNNFFNFDSQQYERMHIRNPSASNQVGAQTEPYAPVSYAGLLA